MNELIFRSMNQILLLIKINAQFGSKKSVKLCKQIEVSVADFSLNLCILKYVTHLYLLGDSAQNSND